MDSLLRPSRGLSALLQSTTHESVPVGADQRAVPGITKVQIGSISPNPNQPRKTFNDENIAELSDSIKSKGIIQPIIVRLANASSSPAEQRYEIVAGERRWRAAKLAGLSEVPVAVRDVSDEADLLVLSLIENLQRDDLNPIEEALAYKHLSADLGLTQEQIAKAVGKSRSVIANALRLLDLPESIRSLVQDGKLSVGHAKILLSVPDERLMVQLAAKCQAEGWSVRYLEAFVGSEGEAGKAQSKAPKTLSNYVASPNVREIEERLTKHLGTRVMLEEGKRRGKIIIEFYSVSDFDRLCKQMGLE